MKTAMQEMIEYLENNDRKFTYTYNKAIELLEKEKNQIISFGKKMQLIQHISYDDDVTFCFDPEKNYNETYQNK